MNNPIKISPGTGCKGRTHPIAELLKREPALTGGIVQPSHDRLALGIRDPDLLETASATRLAIHSAEDIRMPDRERACVG